MPRSRRTLPRALAAFITILSIGSTFSGPERAAQTVSAAESCVAAVPPERGAAATWLRLQRLETTASVLHTTAHPDDEQGGLLAWLAHGQGVRTALLTLNRGEAGDNALGPALFDALGLLRTEELRAAGRLYGLDAQFYTRAADYGFSKRLDEALEQWNREVVLRDMVRAIRTVRPLVVVSRWHGNERDGHGQHQAAGALTPEAVRAAGDPARFPELEREGLRPWTVRKLYMGGVRANEPWTVRVDTGVYSPVLGDTYQNVGRCGLSLQRSQTAGRFVRGTGPAFLYYSLRDRRHSGIRLQPDLRPQPDSLPQPASPANAATRESTFFAGIDTTLPGMYAAAGINAPAGAVRRLQAIAAEIARARAAFRWDDPAAIAPAVARALRLTRALRKDTADEDVRFMLAIEEREMSDALNAALGIELQAIAVPPGTREASGPAAMFAPPATLDPLTPGQSCDVHVTLAAGGDRRVVVRSITLEGPRASSDLIIAPANADQAGLPPGRDALRQDGRSSSDSRFPSHGGAGLQPGPKQAQAGVSVPTTRTWRVRVTPDAEPTRPYFERASIAESHYTVRDEALIGRASAPPLLTAVAHYAIHGTEVSIDTPVVRREANLPYGYESRELEVLPAVTIAVTPRVLVWRADQAAASREIAVDVTNQGEAVTAELRLDAPAGWKTTPESTSVALAAREQRRITFAVSRVGSGFRSVRRDHPPRDVHDAPPVGSGFSRIGHGQSLGEVGDVPLVGSGFSRIRQAPAGGEAEIAARAQVGGRIYDSGYETVRARDLPLRYLTREARVRLRSMDVSIVPGLRVGYVMGAGDEVPAAIVQLGATVDLLGADDLATGDLARFDTIVTGTRAYAVRADLRTHNGRLLEYVKGGGNLVVLYNTPELVPREHAPFPAELPADAEEVCEERAPVELLQPGDPLLTSPNRITAADFEGWIEQRGSKFFSRWDAAYTPLLSSHDRDQAPQQGGMLHARYGRGHYTYMAYALHRQLPAGVPGAYRLLANLLSLGREGGR